MCRQFYQQAPGDATSQNVSNLRKHTFTQGRQKWLSRQPLPARRMDVLTLEITIISLSESKIRGLTAISIREQIEL
jgi:hypothetical protein